MAEPPYDPNLIPPSVYGNRRPVTGELVALLHITFEERGLERARVIKPWMVCDMRASDYINVILLFEDPYLNYIQRYF